jgi:type II secretory pathway pseudopilin PulG
MTNSAKLVLQKRSEHNSPGSRNSESGFMLVYVVLIAALMLIALAIAAPIMAKQLQRDKELESEHRAEQYVRAIRLYYRKNKTYPPSIDALENTNNIRYLRKRYIDPLTGKDNWRIIHVGENKTTVKGFFGQPLGGLNTSGAGSSLGSASGMQSSIGGSSAAGSTGSPSSTVGATSALSAGFSGATIGGSTGSSTTGSSTTGTTGSGTSSSTGSSSIGDGSVGQVMGVGTTKTGSSILNPNDQVTYETWEFIYDPKIELLYQQASLMGGPATVNSQSPSSLGSPAGSTSPTNTLGGLTNTTTTPTAPAPTTPQ